jgi:hypothetical protein
MLTITGKGIGQRRRLFEDFSVEAELPLQGLAVCSDVSIDKRKERATEGSVEITSTNCRIPPRLTTGSSSPNTTRSPSLRRYPRISPA